MQTLVYRFLFRGIELRRTQNKHKKRESENREKIGGKRDHLFPVYENRRVLSSIIILSFSLYLYFVSLFYLSLFMVQSNVVAINSIMCLAFHSRVDDSNRVRRISVVFGFLYLSTQDATTGITRGMSVRWTNVSGAMLFPLAGWEINPLREIGAREGIFQISLVLHSSFQTCGN